MHKIGLFRKQFLKRWFEGTQYDGRRSYANAFQWQANATSRSRHVDGLHLISTTVYNSDALTLAPRAI